MEWPPFKIFLFQWKWILIGLRGFIDRFWQNNFALKLRYGVQNRLQALLEHAIKIMINTWYLVNTVKLFHSYVQYGLNNKKCKSKKICSSLSLNSLPIGLYQRIKLY